MGLGRQTHFELVWFSWCHHQKKQQVQNSTEHCGHCRFSMEAATIKKALQPQEGLQSKQAFPSPKGGTQSQILPSQNGEFARENSVKYGPASLLKQGFKQWPSGQKAPRLKASLLPWWMPLLHAAMCHGYLLGPPLLEKGNPPSWPLSPGLQPSLTPCQTESL